MKLPLALALDVTRGALLDGGRAPALLRVSTDTRSLESGDTFLALRGENFDGHDFAGEAVRKGAALLVLDDGSARVAGTPTMLVERTDRAYLALARLAAEMFDGSIVAITGSTGKTTTKSLLAQLLRTKYRVVASPANENNEIGVGKLLLSLSNGEHDIGIVEMGARHYGDVAVLVEASRPQLGILTNIGDAHVEIMGSRERLAETKWALLLGGARAVLNASDAFSRERSPNLPNAGSTIWFVAVSSVEELHDYAQLTCFTAVVGDRLVTRGWGPEYGDAAAEYRIETSLPGLHNRFNLAAAIAAAMACGVSPESLIPVIPALQLPAGRYDRISIEGGPRVIYDAYNANASGMIAALDAFAGETAARRIAVLASMAELGDESQSLHERVGAYAAGRVDVLLVSGDFAGALARGARSAGLDDVQIVPVEDNSQAAAWLREHANGDDVILLKGSRKYKLEEIVEELHA
jgi:UDP-N-acetylmuramoyl-tripeptide--D-alanyl-D-alanine ligase